MDSYIQLSRVYQIPALDSVSVLARARGRSWVSEGTVQLSTPYVYSVRDL